MRALTEQEFAGQQQPPHCITSGTRLRCLRDESVRRHALLSQFGTSLQNLEKVSTREDAFQAAVGDNR